MGRRKTESAYFEELSCTMRWTIGWARRALLLGFVSASWLASEQTAQAQTLVAQSGVAKTMIGWLLVLLAIGLGILVVCRPSGRKSADGKGK